MKPRTLVALGIVLVASLALGLALWAARRSHRPVEVGPVAGRLRPCPSSPNCVCSEPGSGEASIPPLAFSCEPELALRSLVDFLDAESNAKVVDVRTDYVHAVYYTRLLRFADDVEFRLDPDASVIHVRSASRVGHSDLGANRARVEDLRRRWAPPAGE